MYREIINHIKYIGFIKESNMKYIFREYIIHINKVCFILMKNNREKSKAYSHDFELVIPFLNEVFKHEIRKKKICLLLDGKK